MIFSRIGDEFPAFSMAKACCRFAACALCLGNVYSARASQAAGISPNSSHVGRQTKYSHPPEKGTALATPIDASRSLDMLSRSNTTSKPATVILKDGILTIEANNSDLSQILKDVGDVSGMIVSGSSKSIRVFGVYGPRNPCDVLTDLLTGSGYNFIMLGSTDEGAPRELLLTLRNDDSTDVTHPSRSLAAVAHSESSDTNAPDPDHLGPGAIIHASPPPSQEDPQERVQQNLQRLQKMHEQPSRPQ